MIEDGNVEIINDNYNIQKSKTKSKKVKSTSDVSITNFKEGMKVEWKERNKTLNGIVHKINKRKKKKIEIMLDNGSVKEIDITKLKIYPNYFDCSIRCSSSVGSSSVSII